MKDAHTIGALALLLALLILGLYLLRSKDRVTAQLSFGGFIDGPTPEEAGIVSSQRERNNL